MLDEDLVESLTEWELITTSNFPGIEFHMKTFDSVIEFAESVMDELTALINGNSDYIKISAASIKDMDATCRELINNLNALSDKHGNQPIHLIRIVRQIQRNLMLVASYKELFSEDKVKELRAVWEGEVNLNV